MNKKAALLVCTVILFLCIGAVITVLLVTKQEADTNISVPDTSVADGTTEGENTEIKESPTVVDEPSDSGDTWVDLDEVTVIDENGSVTQNPAESGSELELVTNKFIEMGCTGKVLEEHLDEMGEAEIPVLALRLGLDSWYCSAGPNGLYCAAVVDGEIVVEPYYGE